MYYSILTLPKLQLQEQKLMTSKITSRIEYLTPANNILVLHIHSNLAKNSPY